MGVSKKDAYRMKAKAAATPARLRPALRPEAAPVLSGGEEPVGVPELEPVGLRELGRLMGLVGWTMVELPAGTPVLRMADEVLVMMVVLALLTGVETG
jgi:hypothetical protein